MAERSAECLDDLFVAGWSRDARSGGLHRFRRRGPDWEGELVDPVAGLSALARHPSLPFLYGVSEAPDGNAAVHCWRITEHSTTALWAAPSDGGEPCHLAVDPATNLLVVVHYANSSLSLWQLTADGAAIGAPRVVELSGSGVDPERQERSHPHHVVPYHGELLVTDLGADLVRRFTVSRDPDGSPSLVSAQDSAVPAGTGPRHLTILNRGRVALSGELNSTVLIGSLDNGSWHVLDSRDAPSSAAQTSRNYPGDIQSSPDGAHVYLANRGRDTIAAFSVDSSPRLVAEISAGVAWPQHLAVTRNELLIAGRDSSNIAAWQLRKGLPVGDPIVFDCVGASWLQPW